jgi:hypothetical protein
MSDDMIIGNDGPASPATTGKITETITVNLQSDIPRHQHAKILRQVANILHALLSNGMRYAAIDGGAERNTGAGFQIHQQTYTAAANIDSAAMALENAGRQVLTGALPPPPHGNGMGRA